MKTLIKIIIIIFIFFFVISIAKSGIAKSERAECLKLQSQAEEYELFTMTKDESDMCHARGIIFNAKVL